MTVAKIDTSWVPDLKDGCERGGGSCPASTAEHAVSTQTHQDRIPIPSAYCKRRTTDVTEPTVLTYQTFRIGPPRIHRATA